MAQFHPGRVLPLPPPCSALLPQIHKSEKEKIKTNPKGQKCPKTCSKCCLARPTPQTGTSSGKWGFLQKNGKLSQHLCMLPGEGGGFFLTFVTVFSPKQSELRSRRIFGVGKILVVPAVTPGVVPVVVPVVVVVVVVVSLPSPALPLTQQWCLKRPRSAPKWTIGYKKRLKSRNPPPNKRQER